MVVCTPKLSRASKVEIVEREAIPSGWIERAMPQIALAAPMLRVLLLVMRKMSDSSAFSSLDAYRAPFEPPFLVLSHSPPPRFNPGHVNDELMLRQLIVLGFHGSTPFNHATLLEESACNMTTRGYMAERLIFNGALAWPHRRSSNPALTPAKACPANALAKPAHLRLPLLIRVVQKRCYPLGLMRLIASLAPTGYALSGAGLAQVLMRRAAHSGQRGTMARETEVAELICKLVTPSTWREMLSQRNPWSNVRARPLRPWWRLMCKAIGMLILQDFVVWLSALCKGNLHISRAVSVMLQDVIALCKPSLELLSSCVRVLIECHSTAPLIYSTLFASVSEGEFVAVPWRDLTRHSSPAACMKLICQHSSIPLEGFLAFLAEGTEPLAIIATYEGLVARLGKSTVHHLEAPDNKTLLHLCLAQTRTCMLAITLVNDGIDVNTQDRYGRTPLHELAALQSREINDHKLVPRFMCICEVLVKAGAQPFAQDHQCRTPRELLPRGCRMHSYFENFAT